MLYLAQKGSIDDCRSMAIDSIRNKTAIEYLKKMVELQGGDVSVIEKPDKFKKAGIVYEVKSKKKGYISKMDTEKIGLCSCHLGAGRMTKDDDVDYSAGIVLEKKVSDMVNIGDTLATFYTNDKDSIERVKNDYINALTFSDMKPDENKLIYARIEKGKIEKFL